MASHPVLVLSFCLLLTHVAGGNTDFDCVDIYKQPAFQHPLLKHHKIQLKFSSHESVGRKNKPKTKDQSCPEGTVPILRQRSETTSIHPNAFGYDGYHLAVMETVADGSIYRGAQADISIHNVTVQNDEQYSKSQIWLESGAYEQLNSIQVGWSVVPKLYGDSATRFTIYWTADGNQKTGCYNTLCPGFVIVSRDQTIGSIFGRSSVYGGDTTVFFTPAIIQDGFSGHWVLKVDDEILGYWPQELFTSLKKGASVVRFGGNTQASPDGISPAMGNGYFPVADFQKSSNIVQMKVRNSVFETIDVENGKIRSNADSACFKLIYWGYNKEIGVGFSFGDQVDYVAND